MISVEMAQSTNHTFGDKISTRAFYGVPKLRDALRYTALEKNKHSVGKSCVRRELTTTIVGPSSTWRVFKKQDVALKFSCLRKNKLMTFVYQQTSGERVFIVAHPRVYWHYDVQREQTNRCSFEIIPEHSVCKLYFDLEYEISFNSDKNGIEMTEIFINVVNSWLRQEWHIDIDRSHILDLDSTTDTKFSRHLIYQLPKAAFCNNYGAGNFVRMICNHLRNYINERISLIPYANKVTEVDEYLQSIGRSSLLGLLVTDGKGNSRLFCDEGVYTKNRHFRLYCSTKRNKNAPLVRSPQNQYTSAHSNEEADNFLDSLITYFPSDMCDLRLLEYTDDGSQPKHVCHKLQVISGPNIYEPVSTSYTRSPHPEVDDFINSLVTPGHVWRWFYFSSTNLIVYDIKGYRYCGNINRQHRSNGIKYIVNLSSSTYYQKCHDPDCAGYRSSESKLPLEIAFLYEDEEEYKYMGNSDKDIIFQPTLGSFGLVDQEMAQILDDVENIHTILDKLPNEQVSTVKEEDVHIEEQIIFTPGQSIQLASKEMCESETQNGSRVYEVEVKGVHLPKEDIGHQNHFTNEELIQMMDAVEAIDDIFQRDEGCK